MKQRLLAYVGIWMSAFVISAGDPPHPVTLAVMVEPEGIYFADAPVYVDLVLSNNGPKDVKFPHYPTMAVAGRVLGEYGTGIFMTLKDEVGERLKIGESIQPYTGTDGLYPPDATLGKGEAWRWTSDLRAELKCGALTRNKDLPSGEFELTVLLERQGISSAPVKIKLVRGADYAATKKAAENLRPTTLRESRLYPLRPLVRPEEIRRIELDDQLLPTFRRMLRAIYAIGALRKGEPEAEVLARLPTEAEWGIWADDLAAARYAQKVKSDQEAAKLVRLETETSYPGICWLLRLVERGNPKYNVHRDPNYCWLYPIF